jgi:hypothetical protein
MKLPAHVIISTCKGKKKGNFIEEKFCLAAVLRIRIHMFLGLLDLDPDLLVRDLDPDPSIIK